ncbi:MAG: hypothetical protein ACYDAI_14960 [Trichloromonadaceae bacterium]
MRERLIAAKLWKPENVVDPGQSIIAAWEVLCRLGEACRYGGKSQDGYHEYLIVHPADGRLLASGKGASTPEALCAAALAAHQQLQQAPAEKPAQS